MSHVLVFIVLDRVSSPANFWHCILCVYVMAIEDMDTSGPSREDSPPQVFLIGTSSSPSDASIRSLVVQAIQDYCSGKLIDDLSQFQRVEQQGEITFSIVNMHSNRLEALVYQVQLLKKYRTLAHCLSVGLGKRLLSLFSILLNTFFTIRTVPC